MKKLFLTVTVSAGIVSLFLSPCFAQENYPKGVERSDLTSVNDKAGELRTDFLKEIETRYSTKAFSLNEMAKYLSNMPLFSPKDKDKLFAATLSNRPRFSFDIPFFGDRRLEVSFHLDQKKPSPIDTDQKKEKILSSEFSIRW